jgi:hypothetical protein
LKLIPVIEYPSNIGVLIARYLKVLSLSAVQIIAYYYIPVKNDLVSTTFLLWFLSLAFNPSKVDLAYRNP